MCCGQKREVESRGGPLSLVRTQTQTQRVAAAAPDRNLTVTLRYRQRSAITIRGAATGTRYQFSNGGSMQAVDRRDADGLVATGLFEKIWG
jgi:hypothetical protein